MRIFKNRHHLKITKRRIAFLIGIWLLIIAIPLILTAMQLRWGNLRENKTLFGRWNTPGHERRIVVFAPHCDDETLGTGGLLRQASLRGAEVWVVLITNGDGSRYAATIDSRAIKIKPPYYIKFGYRRQKETTEALKKLGITHAHIVTLGYPDRGIEPMWLSYWRTPYTSLYTHDSASPYTNSYTKGARYTGLQLESDLKKLLREIDPTDIYYPHPNDQHPDHWATSAFVTESLYELGWLQDRNIGLYLVHRGDWPVPQGLHENIHLAPPAAFADLNTDWYQYPLDSKTVKDKKAAVEEFRSQTSLIRRFLRCFVRQNELFGEREVETRLTRDAAIHIDGKIDDWDGIEPIILDPVDDGLPVHTRPGADITKIYAAADSKRLYLRITTRGIVRKGTLYGLRVHPLNSSVGTIHVTIRRGKKPPSDWQVAFGKKDIEASYPLCKLRNQPLLVSVGTKVNWYQIDRSAYRILLP